MQNTSSRYQSILASDNSLFETQLVIGGGCGRNLCNSSCGVSGKYINGSNKYVSSSNTASVVIPCDSLTTYTLSKAAGSRFRVGFCHERPATNTVCYGVIQNDAATSITITTDAEAQYIVAYIWYKPSDNSKFSWSEMVDTVKVWQGTFTAYGESALYDIQTGNEMLSNAPEVGKVIAGEITIKMFDTQAEIPAMACIQPQVRVCNATAQSEWISQGVFFTDTRERTNNDDGLEILTIHGFDAMLKTEQDYPSTQHSWPYLDISVVNEIALEIGVNVDGRTTDQMTAGYMVELPAGYTMREVLGEIAAYYAGNFVLSDEGELLFVPLYGFDPEIDGCYLADTDNSALTYGNEGWFILA